MGNPVPADTQHQFSSEHCFVTPLEAASEIEIHPMGQKIALTNISDLRITRGLTNDPDL